MEVSVIKIGNSKGIRLGKTILERYGIKDKIELIFEDNCLVLKPIAGPREGWEEAFKAMHKNQDDELLIDDIFSDETLDEWQ